jgi:PST family polysaccharide transporter
VASWPLGFIFLAAGDGKTFFWTEISALLVMVLVIAGLLRRFGLEITGFAYLAFYIFYLPLIHWLAKSRMGFRWSSPVVRLLAITFAVCMGVGVVACTTRWGALARSLTAVAFAVHALGRLSHMGNLGGTAGKIGAMAQRLTAAIGGRTHE